MKSATNCMFMGIIRVLPKGATAYISTSTGGRTVTGTRTGTCSSSATRYRSHSIDHCFIYIHEYCFSNTNDIEGNSVAEMQPYQVP